MLIKVYVLIGVAIWAFAEIISAITAGMKFTWTDVVWLPLMAIIWPVELAIAYRGWKKKKD